MQQPYQLLEEELSKWPGVGQHKEVAVVNSGTSALQLALQALELPRGSKVIVPTFSFVAVARAVVMAGLEPVFVDCGEDGLMDVDLVKDHGGRLTHALMPVHTYGRRCDMENLTRLAKMFGQRVIEDLAEAHGVEPHSDSDAACWSFYRNKLIAGEEGGACAFLQRDIADRVKVLRNQGHWGSDDTWDHAPGGGNYRLANALAEPILKSLSQYHTNLKLRRGMERRYDEQTPDGWKMPPRHSPWVYDLRIKEMKTAQQDRLMVVLRDKGIEARRGFRPIHRMREFEGQGCITAGNYSGGRETVADVLFREVICLPLWPFDTSLPERTLEIVKKSL